MMQQAWRVPQVDDDQDGCCWICKTQGTFDAVCVVCHPPLPEQGHAPMSEGDTWNDGGGESYASPDAMQEEENPLSALM